MISNFKDYAQKHSDEIGIAYTASDVRKLKKAGKLIGIMAIENGYALGKDISNVKMFYDMGVRYITLSHNNNNDVCDAAVTEDNPKRGFKKGPEWHGLSPFGIKVVEEHFGNAPILIHAQAYATGFYEKVGFRISSEPFLEDGIPHHEMIRPGRP